MAEPGGKLQTVRLKTPVEPEAIAALELGQVVYLDGVVYTGREGVYQRCSPAAAVEPDGSTTVRAVTATASFRFAKWLPKWFQISGCKVIIGKGGMTEKHYREIFVPVGAVYLTTVGYGTGALLGRGIKQVKAVHWLDELGIAQAMWVFEVANFGPFLVESDLEGNSLFEANNRALGPRIESLYKGLGRPALSRYGESDDPKEELI
jgi:L(+)-tartrate dehydratase beta subunit